MLAVVDTLEVGGAEVSLAEILGRLSGRGHRVELCPLYPGATLRGRFEAAGVQVHPLNLPGRYALLSGARRIVGRARETRPDLLFATLFRAGIAARLAARRTGIPLIDSLVNDSYSPRRFAALDLSGRLKLRGVQALDRATARWVDRFVAVSEVAAEAGRRDLGIATERRVVIHRGRNPDVYRPGTPAERAALRERLRAGPEERVLLATSRLLARKGHRELLEAMPAILDAQPTARLLLAGGGPERRSLEELAARLEIAHRISFLGTRQDVPELLRASDVFVFPSHFEGLPGSLVEAMLTGLPIVAADTSHNRECLGEPTTALLFPAGDAGALAATVLAALADPGAGAVLGERARASACERFSVESVVDAYENLMAEVAARRPPAGRKA